MRLRDILGRHGLLAAATTSLLLDWSLAPVLGRDTDFWWNLAAGRQIWNTGRIPLTDSFSYTWAGARWLHLHWLFQWLLYGAWRLGGMDAAVGLRSVLFLGAMALLADTARRRGAGAAATAGTVLWVGAIVMRYAFVRPHFASLLLGALLLRLLEAGPRAAWGLPLVLLVWNNTHSCAALVGLVVVALYALCGRCPRPAVVLPLCVLATLTVPQPFTLVQYALKWTFAPNPFGNLITEYAPPRWSDPQNAPTLAFLVAYGTLALAGLWRAYRHRGKGTAAGTGPAPDPRPVLDFLLLAAFSVLVQRGWRHQFLLVPFLAPGMAAMGCARLRSLGSLARHPATRVAAAALLLLVAAREAVAVARWDLPPARLIRRETIPAGACAFLRANGLHGRLFNDLNWGGYLIWALPDSRVYIDSRCDQVYADPGFIAEYLDTLYGRPGALATLDRRGVDIVVTSRLFDRSPLFTRLLPAAHDWALVYNDGSAHVFVRRRLLPAHLHAPDDFMTRYRAGLRRLDTPSAAIASFQAALADYPDFAAAHLQRGVAEATSGDARDAARDWREALRLNPEEPDAHKNLGLLALEQGRGAEAACQFAAELAQHPDNAVARAQAARLPSPAPALCALRSAWDAFRAPLW